MSYSKNFAEVFLYYLDKNTEAIELCSLVGIDSAVLIIDIFGGLESLYFNFNLEEIVKTAAEDVSEERKEYIEFLIGDRKDFSADHVLISSEAKKLFNYLWNVQNVHLELFLILGYEKFKVLCKRYRGKNLVIPSKRILYMAIRDIEVYMAVAKDDSKNNYKFLSEKYLLHKDQINHIYDNLKNYFESGENSKYLQSIGISSDVVSNFSLSPEDIFLSEMDKSFVANPLTEDLKYIREEGTV